MTDRDRALGALHAALIRRPNLRLGQVIANAIPDRFHNDPYYVSDADLADYLARVGFEPDRRQPTDRERARRGES